MPKQGFNNQWVAISRVGKVADSTGVERDLNEDFLKKVCANFAANNAPAVIGHPKDNNPAYGWVSAIRLQNGTLEAQFADTDDEFEKMCADGKLRKRSASFYIGDKPSLRHVGFLGAMPPAVKGLRDIQFNDGDSVTVEISFSEENTVSKENENAQDEKKTALEWMKEFFGGRQNAPATASFTEADAKRIAEEAAKTATEKATADFNEKYEALEKTNKELSDRVNSMSGNSKRAEIISFVEGIPAEKGKHFLKNIGTVEFLEACAKADEADKEPAVVCFSEMDGKKEEHKFSRLDWAKTFLSSLPTMIEFGEKFGDFSASSEVTVLPDLNRAKQINSELGLDGGDK